MFSFTEERKQRVFILFFCSKRFSHTMPGFCSIAALSFLFAAYSASGAKIVNNTTDVRTKTNGRETIVCNQYIGQEANAHEAIKKLDEKLSKKLDQLIKLLQPGSTIPGKNTLFYYISTFSMYLNRYSSPLPLISVGLQKCKHCLILNRIPTTKTEKLDMLILIIRQIRSAPLFHSFTRNCLPGNVSICQFVRKNVRLKIK